MTLIEVVVATAVLVIGIVGVLAGLQRANGYGRESETRAAMQLLGESALQRARRAKLAGAGGLYDLSTGPAHGWVLKPSDLLDPGNNPYRSDLVAVVRCKGDKTNVRSITAPYEVDLSAAGLPATTLKMVRIHVQVMVAQNPDEPDADQLVPAVQPGVPPPLDLVAYRVAEWTPAWTRRTTPTTRARTTACGPSTATPPRTSRSSTRTRTATAPRTTRPARRSGT
jgi:type II secretory pathway pseudopilin PulG